MGKLRYAAPAVVAGMTVGMMAAQSGTAFAAAHNDKCTKELCLWFSTGASAGIYQSNQEIVWSNFSNDCAIRWPKACTFDHFTNGTGANDAVRNDAHSMANDGPFNDFLYSLPDNKGVEFTLGPNGGKPVTLPANIRNNEASEKSSECSLAENPANPYHLVC